MHKLICSFPKNLPPLFDMMCQLCSFRLTHTCSLFRSFFSVLPSPLQRLFNKLQGNNGRYGCEKSRATGFRRTKNWLQEQTHVKVQSLWRPFTQEIPEVQEIIIFSSTGMNSSSQDQSLCKFKLTMIDDDDVAIYLRDSGHSVVKGIIFCPVFISHKGHLSQSYLHQSFYFRTKWLLIFSGLTSSNYFVPLWWGESTSCWFMM